jgi:hypothetical protein
MMAMIPVFIGGCDRSGTTLLGSMLGTHSECLCTPESQFIVDVLSRCDLDANHIDPQRVLDIIVKHPRFKIWALNVKPSHSSYRQANATYPELVEWIVKEYGVVNGKGCPRIWIDHTPSNIKYAATLVSLFPQARLIHIVRDGRAVASSLLSVSWGPAAIDRATYYWLRNLAYGLAAESSCDPANVMRIKYEDLVIASEDTLRKVSFFLGIDYQPQMIKGDGFQVPSLTRRDHVLVGQAPDRRRVDAWQNELTLRQIEIFESITGDMLRYLGYDMRFGPSAKSMTVIERCASSLKTWQMVIGKLWQRIRLQWS